MSIKIEKKLLKKLIQAVHIYNNTIQDFMTLIENRGLGPHAKVICFSETLPFLVCPLKGTVQPELRWVKIGINRTAMKICIAGKCRLSCPKGHHHERSINILGGCNTF